ncbi:MAG TPA: hypothetical protein VH281_05110 [Gaiellaceae bacterium]
MRIAAAALATTLLATVAASAALAVVTEGTIRQNRGAAGIRLGMTRAEVVKKLGQPLFENANGYMQYGPDNRPILFDVYRGGHNRVRLLGISGRHFCLASGTCMRERFGLRKLRHEFGERLKTVHTETGETVYVLRSRFHGRRSFTSFSTTSDRARARILMTFIGWCPPRPNVCGA